MFRSNYKQSLTAAMAWLGKRPDTLFIGQTVGYPGSYMYASLRDVRPEKKLELPVAEELQMGISLGLALEGFVPISVFPRFDFLLLALNQLVNHIDKIGWMSEAQMQPRIIIRTSTGPRKPLDAGPQHTQDHSEAVKRMLTTVTLVTIKTGHSALPWYKRAYKDERRRLWLFVESGELYGS